MVILVAIVGRVVVVVGGLSVDGEGEEGPAVLIMILVGGGGEAVVIVVGVVSAAEV